MSETAPEATPAAEAPAAPEAATPKWEGDFSPERAARLVENLRGDIEKLRARNGELSTKLGEREDAEKTEVQRLTDRLAKAEKDATEARSELLVSRIAREHGIPDELKSFLAGADEEEIAVKAKLLADKLGAAGKTPELPGKPKAKLTAGHQSVEPTDDQLSREDLARMSPEDIVRARNAGQLNSLLGLA